jgi:two-component system, LytTR family, sensor histidine kinase AlgZ
MLGRSRWGILKLVQLNLNLGHYLGDMPISVSSSLTQSNLWLPEFRSSRSLLGLMVLAQVITLVVLIATSTQATQFWPRLGPASLLAQWIALCVGICLNLARSSLLRRAPALAAAMSLLIVALAAFMAVLVADALQRTIFAYSNPSLGIDSAWRIAFVAAILAAAGLRYNYVQQQWLLEMQSTARAKIDALTARIRPHFLFNSMNTLASLISIDAEKAETVVEDLSALFRAALQSDQSITLAQELELAEQYLAIEQLRLGKRLQVVRDIALDAEALATTMPALLLQPLVENAVYHGIQPKVDGGVLRLSAKQTGGCIDIVIENPIGAHAKDVKGNGVALENIRARLRLAFAEQAQLLVEIKTDVFVATLRLPMNSHSVRR